MDNFNFLQFEPAQLFAQKIWYVQFKAVNPATGKLVRIRIKLNRVKPISERKKYAAEVIKEVNKRLYNGWNPFTEKEVAKGFVKLVDACNTFLNNKRRELRADSIRSYESFIKNFKDYLLLKDMYNIFCINFTQQDARDYMAHVYNVQKVNARTHNNYRHFQINLFNWLLEQQYIKINVFSGMKDKKEPLKIRKNVSAEIRENIKNHLKKTDFPFFIVTQLVYFTLIRPKEICYLKRSNFDLEKQTIFVSGTFAKNGNDRISTIPNALMDDLLEFNFNGAAEDQLIFSEKLQPGKKIITSRVLSKKWATMRKKLNIPMDNQLYSLRDTGIIEMLKNGISPEEVMRQADHSSLEMTTVYIKHANPNGSYEIKNKLKDF